MTGTKRSRDTQATEVDDTLQFTDEDTQQVSLLNEKGTPIHMHVGPLFPQLQVPITPETVIAFSDETVFVMHPCKWAFVHVVVLPQKPVRSISAYHRTLRQQVSRFIDRYSAISAAQALLERYPTLNYAELYAKKENLSVEDLQLGDDASFVTAEEVAEFMSSYASKSGVGYRVGFLAVHGKGSSTQLHILSSELEHVPESASYLWSLIYNKKYFQCLDDKSLKVDGNEVYPRLSQIAEVLQILPLKCPTCDTFFDSLSNLRRHTLITHDQETLSLQENTLTTNTPTSENSEIGKDRLAKPEETSVREVQTTFPEAPTRIACKENINSVTSAFLKWCKYGAALNKYEHSLENVPEDVKEKHQREQTKVQEEMQKLLEKSWISGDDKRKLLFLQRRVEGMTKETVKK
mmetsp:Transcript_17945/g.24928  ORF Transcript_17945/g.24928 Transcript_17945/m.24928 type:complete len:406 (-) Transcript_17945:48-1265(-)|eukprot:CAMPEP_0201485296 /NCGR_PEP_ID=MMETSP0151_2-20130828/9414_1 /ASSEMBLY_ACC=CAM_ASM_000257 /TAXON_ID=200890 /ORGANISM="Paramoeba atlantica, Strain 621/1 / CCAP 1560/9" /LENGTH=405 /DNA_ID=CAMNT_0047869365 /DNA_START=90 /DNA_END=1307 /DNA_ORIENTATION=+